MKSTRLTLVNNHTVSCTISELDLPYLTSNTDLVDQISDDEHVHTINFDKSNSTITFSVRESSFYYKLLHGLGYSIDIGDILNVYNGTKFDVSDAEFLRDYQYEVAKLITTKFNGLICLHTGWGKNTLIAYLVKHWRDTGNILIMAPTLSLTDEIRMRCARYGINWDNSKWDSRYHYMVPQGFIHSNASNDESVKQWMSNVNMILIDECETATDSMQIIIDNYCPNCKYIYGFSGSANKFENMDLRNLYNYNRLHYETYLSLKYIGPGLVYNISNDVLNVFTRHDEINSERCNPWMNEYSRYSAALNALMSSESVVKLTREVMALSDHTIFFPVKTKAQAADMMFRLDEFARDNNYLMVNWDASGIYTNQDTDSNRLIKDYEDLKSWVDSDKVKIIFATSVATKGIDFQLVSDVILLTLQQYNQITQAVGRMSRYKGQQNVYLLCPTNEKRADINIGCYRGKVNKLRQSHECRFYDF